MFDECKHPDKCPWRVAPVVGMWAKRGDIQFWGTNCLLYIDCPRWKYGTKWPGPAEETEVHNAELKGAAQQRPL